MTRIKLGNGSQVFACCGGTSFHVGGWHPEMAAEHAEEKRIRDEYQAEQEKRRSDLVGEVLTRIEVGQGHWLTLTFENGHTLKASLVGGELDGHFDPPGNRSLRVEVLSKTEARKATP